MPEIPQPKFELLEKCRHCSRTMMITGANYFQHTGWRFSAVPIDKEPKGNIGRLASVSGDGRCFRKLRRKANA